ncbi:MAG: amino acid permease [Acidipila sp.]|nr:amino acid permease [Acidipila sp.]
MTGSSESTTNRLVPTLGLLDSTMIVVGSMIGSGIFVVSADISRQVQSPALLLTVWLVSGVMTMIGALSYGELAAAMPTAGGQYVYLRESLGPLWGFLYGWTMLLVIQTATIAAVAIGFSKFAGVLVPWFSSSSWLWKMGTMGPFHFWFGNLGPYNVGLNTQNLLAILSIALLTWLNTRGLRIGSVVQNIFTIAKTGALAGLILLGLFFGRESSRITNLSNFWGPGGAHFYSVGNALVPIGTMALVGVAMVGALFSSDAWNNITFLAAEVKEPKKNLPAALALGTLIVCALYLLANFAYLNVLPLQGVLNGSTALERGIQFAAEDRVGTAVAGMILGSKGAILMAVAILISTFGCNNGLILAGARVYYAMARDGLFFRSVGRLNRFHVPGAALVVQGIWASVLCLSGTYSQLLDFLIFAVLVFYILTISGLIVLRFRRPEMDRPYRAFGYPVLPVLYLVMAVFIEVQLLRYKPEYTWPGLILVVLGIPVYWLWRLLGSKETAKTGQPGK